MTPIDLSDFSPIDKRYLLNFCRTLTKHPDDAEDLMQTTLLKALRSNYEGRCARRTWLCFIARTEFLQWIRRSKSRIKEQETTENSEAPPIPDRRESQLGSVLREEANRHIRLAIASLPPWQRQILTLIYLEGCTLNETVERTGLALGTVKCCVFRGRQRIKPRLKALMGIR